MNLSHRLDILARIYDAYEAFSAGLSVACRRGCASCCTQNVTMTTLEGYRIFQYLEEQERLDLLGRTAETISGRRYQPELSTNYLAAFCLREEEPPEEKTDWPVLSCPFLSNNECLIYRDRPFGCRCFLSSERCEENAYAVVDPFVVTVNTLFLQFVEHADAGGFFGNMSDVLAYLESEARREAYKTGNNSREDFGFPVNRPIPGLLVPPEHQLKVRAIFEKLRRVVD